MFFIFLSLTTLCYVHAQSVLIICNAGCDCVTETGVAVACSFIKNAETTVIRAIETPTGQFAPVRIIPIESEYALAQSDPRLQFTCPTKAGAAANDEYSMCSPIDSSKIQEAAVRMSGDVTEESELQFVEHFVSPIGNLSLVVTERQKFGRACAVNIKSHNPSVRYARVRQFLQACLVNTRNPRNVSPRKPDPPAAKKSGSVGDAAEQLSKTNKRE